MTIQELINKLQSLIETEVSPNTEILFKEIKYSSTCSIEFIEINHVDSNGDIITEDEDEELSDNFQKCVVLESWA